MVKEETKPYGYIYVATNRVNGKVYVGQTGTSRWVVDRIPIEERWKEEIQEGYRIERRGEELRLIEKAVIKYGADNFDLKEVDTANNQEELDAKERHWIKELDAMNREKGYNMTEGGMGGRPSQEVRERISKIGTEKWENDVEYIEKQNLERRERAKNPEWLEKMASVNQEIARKPEYIKNMSGAISKKWEEKEYQDNVSKGATDKWQEVKYRKRQFSARREGKREISDKGEFLKDIQDMTKKDLNSKYDMDGKSINKRIEEMLGHHGVKNFSQAKKFLENKNLDKMLKDINERLDSQNQQFTGKKEISNTREFLEDIQNLKTKEIEQKYDMNRSTATKRIREMLGDKGVKNFTDTKEYLKDKDLDEVVKDINERMSDQTQKFEGKTEISNKREFLEDIQNLQKNEIDHKYGMDGKTINNKIKGMLGEHGVKNYTDAKKFLDDKDLNDVLKDIEKRESGDIEENGLTESGSEESKGKTSENFNKSGIGVNYKNLIDDKREFLNDMKRGMTELDIYDKYKISGSTLDLVIKDMFGENGPRNHTSLYHHLQNRDIDDVLNDIKAMEADSEIRFDKNLSTENSSAENEESNRDKSSKDYEGIDQVQADKGEDFEGIDENSDDDSAKDFNNLDDFAPERGIDFDGIDSPQEKGDKDFDNIDEGHPEGSGESGGGP